MKKILLFLVMIFIASCAENHLTIAAKTTKISAQQGFSEEIYQTKNFKIFTLQKFSKRINPQKNLRIYFEGDGKAFINKSLISENPTPTSYFLINLIIKDSSPNIIYIARPCQFTDDKNCQKKYWSDARFSEEILISVNEVVRNFSEFNLELIGYSGGAEIAKYVAAENKNTINLRTIAGNLDHKKFTEIHQVPTLGESFNDEKILPKLENIPQIHFVGSDDKIIPSSVAESYLQKLSKKSCVKIIKVDNTTHSRGWQKKWPKLLEIKPSCEDLF